MRNCLKPALLGLTILMAGCLADRHSPSGFHLPPDGSPERGQAAFLALGCTNCHWVSGVDLPEPTVRPPVPVVLGGRVAEAITDGYFVTAIINPGYQLKRQMARYPRNAITSNGGPRMPNYGDRITARQLTDVVAFLQSTYTVRRDYPAYIR